MTFDPLLYFTFKPPPYFLLLHASVLQNDSYICILAKVYRTSIPAFLEDLHYQKINCSEKKEIMISSKDHKFPPQTIYSGIQEVGKERYVHRY